MWGTRDAESMPPTRAHSSNYRVHKSQLLVHNLPDPFKFSPHPYTQFDSDCLASFIWLSYKKLNVQIMKLMVVQFFPSWGPQIWALR